MHPATSPNCFWRCGQLGTMYHTWWQCPLVTRFWIWIFNLINSVTGVNIRRSPKAPLFHKLPDEIPKQSIKLIKYILLAARITMARHWKQSIIPLDQVKNKLNWIMINDKLTHILSNKVKKFIKIWDPWIDYFNSIANPRTTLPLSSSLPFISSSPLFFFRFCFFFYFWKL